MGGAVLFGDICAWEDGSPTSIVESGVVRPIMRLEFATLEVLRRSASAPRLRLSTEDIVAPEGSDGTVDRMEVEWARSGGHPALHAFVRTRWDVVTARIDFGDGQVMSFASPKLSRFLLLATARFHGPIADVYARAAQDGSLRVTGPREVPPAKTSFPPLAPLRGTAPSTPTMSAHPILPRSVTPSRPIR
jgi:hypothetical protein